MKAIHASANKDALPDFSLLIDRLEKQILSNAHADKAVQVLKSERIWDRLDDRQRLKWANLAQMAGESDVACRLLDHIHRTSPHFSEAWQAHLELLRILDNKTEIARLLALSRESVADTHYKKWLQAFELPHAAAGTDDFREVALPFETLHARRQALDRYLNIFCGREDCFARQWVDKKTGRQGYVPVRRPMALADLEDHLKGLKTYGIYLLQSSGLVQTAVIDVDLHQDYRGGKQGAESARLVKRELHYMIGRLTELAEAAQLHPLIEFSGGKGYHFWFFFDTPAEPGTVRSALEIIKKSIAGDLSAFTVEVFPKQDHLSGKGFGNLVKLPLGVHRLTGKRSCFIQCRDRSVDVQLDFLAKAATTDSKCFAAVQESDVAKRVLMHPKWEKWAKAYPELFALEHKCPPLGQIISVCRNEKSISPREEKVLVQTIGFLPRAKTLLHHLLAPLPDYNPHLVDYRLSRVRGTPLGCRRIHSLLQYVGDFCRMNVAADYQHPLLHIDEAGRGDGKKSEKTENLTDAMANLKAAIIQVERFIS